MLGSRLKKLRAIQKLTQKQLAEKINVTNVSISGYESGNRFPDTDTLQRLADYFEVSTDYLLGRTDEPKGLVGFEFMKTFKEMVKRRNKLDMIKEKRDLTENELDEYKILSNYMHDNSSEFDIDPIKIWMELKNHNQLLEENKDSVAITVAGQVINLSLDELKLFNELKKHPIMFHDLASNPEKKVKELIKLYKMKQMFLDEDEEEHEEGFGDFED